MSRFMIGLAVAGTLVCGASAASAYYCPVSGANPVARGGCTAASARDSYSYVNHDFRGSGYAIGKFAKTDKARYAPSWARPGGSSWPGGGLAHSPAPKGSPFSDGKNSWKWAFLTSGGYPGKPEGPKGEPGSECEVEFEPVPPIDNTVPQVPVPAAGWALMTAFGGLAALRRKRRA